VAKAKRPPQTKKKLGGPRIGENGPRQAKATAVADVQERLQGSSAVVLTEYRGMTVQELAELRRSLREAGADYKVYKNTLATIAARNAGLDDLVTALEGPTAFAFTHGDPVVVAKRLADFAKKVPALILKAGVLDGRILSSGEVSALSALDSREVMLAKAAGMFLSPIQKLVNLFAAPLNQLGGLFAQLRDKMPAEQPSPEAAAPEAASGPEAEPPEVEATAPEAEAAAPVAEAVAPEQEPAPAEEVPAPEAAAAPEVAAPAAAEEAVRPVEGEPEAAAPDSPEAEEPVADAPEGAKGESQDETATAPATDDQSS
jgi:large subunit ribosomal protein L10